MVKYSPKLPLEKGTDDTHLMLNTILGVVKQNMRMVILTNPGERIMMPNFGVGIYRFLFENIDPITMEAVREKIRTQVARFLPYVEIGAIELNSSDTNDSVDRNTINVSIRYFIPSLNAQDVLRLNVDSEQF